MFRLIIIAFFATLATALPQNLVRPGLGPVLSRVEARDEAGQFSLQYQTGDGTVFTEQGALKRTPDGADNVLVKQGSYRFTSPEGVPIEVSYTADELGFHPQSSAIPVQQILPEIVFT